MKFKRLISAALGAAMALSLAVPAFATNTVITATYTEPKIEVSVPTTATAVINPFALPTKFYFDPTTGKTCKADTEGAVAFSTPASAVASQPMFLVNYGETNLLVSATATATVKTGSDLKVATDVPEPADDGTLPDKTVTIGVSASSVKDVAAQWKVVGDATKESIEMSTATATAWGKIDWTDASSVKTAVALSEDAEETSLGSLAGIDATTKKVKDAGILAIAVTGGATKKAKTAWTSKDIVTLTVAYSFEVDPS